MSELKIHLFGYPSLEADGVAIPIRRRKALALLAYLAATGSGHSRDVLATLLWPEHDPTRAYAFLRNALWILNRTPLSNWLVATRHTIGLRKDPSLEVDVASFRSAVSGSLDDSSPASIDRLVTAERTYRAGFLEGFTVEDSEPFDDWQISESNALRQELASCLERLADVFTSQHRTDDAARVVRRWLEAQPLDETVHRRMMELLAFSGQRAAALRQFEKCETILREELGLSPSQETLALADRIRDGTIEPASRTPAPAVPVRLPTYRTPLIGRNKEISRAVEILLQDACRLLTITGPGGCGKTRLAVAVGAQAVSGFPDGVVFVALASTASSSAVPLHIADAIGASVFRGVTEHTPTGLHPRSAFDLLVDRLGDHRTLLILDNMEHLLVDLRWLVGLLERAPSVTMLVTSRHQLELAEEWVFPIEGLAFPEAASVGPDLVHFDSVSLFIQSARRADASFYPSEEDWGSISQIVRLLEGIPLGIELAASWVRSMSCTAIADEIEGNLGFLSAKRRDVPRRHHSLRAAFDESWRLLGPGGRDAFRRLSVFRSGFTASAAEVVVGASLPTLSSLVTRSLLRRSAGDRYEMLEVLRQYAAERLRTMPEEVDSVRDAHSAYYLDLLAEQEGALKTAGQRDAAERLAPDDDNVRAAWHRAIEGTRSDAIARAAMGLFLILDMRNHFDEGEELFSAAADGLPSDGTAERSRLLGFLKGFQAWFARSDRRAPAETLFRESLAILEPCGTCRELAFVRLLWSFSGFGRAEERRRSLAEALAFFETTGYVWESAEAHSALAWTLREEDPDAAIEHARRSLAIHEELADPWGTAMARYALSSIHCLRGEYAAARAEAEESLALRRGSGLDPSGALQCITTLGYIAQRSEDWQESVSRYEEALAIAEDRSAHWLLPGIHEMLAVSLSHANRTADALDHARVALRMYRAAGTLDAVERCEAMIASLARE